MGTASAEVTHDLLERLKTDFSDIVHIIGEPMQIQEKSDNSPEILLVTVDSHLLKPGKNGVTEIVILGGKLAFKRWADT